MKQYFFLPLAILLFGCANIVAPTGGPKDKDAPQWKQSKSTPDSLHRTNFKGDKIVLEFNEQVDIKNLSTELISNPDVSDIIKYKAKKNKAILKKPSMKKPGLFLNI